MSDGLVAALARALEDCMGLLWPTAVSMQLRAPRLAEALAIHPDFVRVSGTLGVYETSPDAASTATGALTETSGKEAAADMDGTQLTLSYAESAAP